jgi:hypothetical protein
MSQPGYRSAQKVRHKQRTNQQDLYPRQGRMQ